MHCSPKWTMLDGTANGKLWPLLLALLQSMLSFRAYSNILRWVRDLSYSLIAYSFTIAIREQTRRCRAERQNCRYVQAERLTDSGLHRRGGLRNQHASHGTRRRLPCDANLRNSPSRVNEVRSLSPACQDSRLEKHSIDARSYCGAESNGHFCSAEMPGRR